jgi:hypothetical protein
MAGAGKKTFVAGEVLLAQDVNDYLMDQSIMNFASDAARGSAIPTPTEGMFALTKDTDIVHYYNGSAWVPALPIGAWETWAPALAGGWLNGNGTWSATYAQLGKTVYVSALFTIGSSTTKGGGLSVSLPVTMASSGRSLVGSCRLDSATNNFIGHVSANSTTQIQLWAQNASGTYLVRTAVDGGAGNIPSAWNTGNTFTFNLVYQAA